MRKVWPLVVLVVCSVVPGGGGCGGSGVASGGIASRAAAEVGGYGGGADGAPQTWRRVVDAPRFAEVRLGGGETLELERVRVTVLVEGMRARTVVDHVFRNPHGRDLEGTFRYSLPPEASVSSYAVFLGDGEREPSFVGSDQALEELGDEARVQLASVDRIVAQAGDHGWGELRVGRIVRSTEGRRTYEDVTRRRIDPALVDEVGPNTFEARVFPIRAGGRNRVVVAYEQMLPRVEDTLEYLFPVPQGELESFELALAAPAPYTERVEASVSIEGAEVQTSPDGRAFHVRLAGAIPGGHLGFRMLPSGQGPLEVLAGTDAGRQESHFVMRLTAPEGAAGPQARPADSAVFVLDTSLSEHPDRFGIDVALMRAILERSSHVRRFAVLTFDAGARWLGEGWLDNDAAGRERALRMLDGVLLEGATDFSAALDALARPAWDAAGVQNVDVHVLTDGAVTWGQRDPGTMLAAFEARAAWNARFFAYRTGLGAENLELLRALTRTGAIFNCLTTDSVPACATAHHAAGMRIDRVTVEGTGAQAARVADLIVAGRQASLFPGAQLLVAGKLAAPGTAVLKLSGTVGGRPRTLEYPVRLEPHGELAPQAWAETAVAQLLETHDRRLEDLAVALSQRYRVPSRLTSFLVLETDAEYEQHDLKEERSELEGREIAPLVDDAIRQLGRSRSAWDRLHRALTDGAADNGLAALEDGSVFVRLAAMVDPRPSELLDQRTRVPLVMRADVPDSYAQELSNDPDAHAVFRREADRRMEAGELGAAVRALSSVVENDPGSAEAARMVAYRLQTWHADAMAADLLLGVLERRPYEPQSYRDLANVLWTRRPSITALLFEAALAGNWDARFGLLETVVREEYALFIRDLRRRMPESPLATYLAGREQALGLEVPESDLRVTMTWNTDNTDIDLWVTDPEGEKCYYANRLTGTGAQLLDDITRGFGPERMHAEEAVPGEYLVQAHYYANNGNRLVAETYVTMTIATHLGTPQETVRRYVLELAEPGDVATVTRVAMD